MGTFWFGGELQMHEAVFQRGYRTLNSGVYKPTRIIGDGTSNGIVKLENFGFNAFLYGCQREWAKFVVWYFLTRVLLMTSFLMTSFFKYCRRYIFYIMVFAYFFIFTMDVLQLEMLLIWRLGCYWEPLIHTGARLEAFIALV